MNPDAFDIVLDCIPAADEDLIEEMAITRKASRQGIRENDAWYCLLSLKADGTIEQVEKNDRNYYRRKDHGSR